MNEINKEYGCYIIKEKLPERTNDGHIKYKAVCKFCGKEYVDRLQNIKMIKNDKCYHYAHFGEITIPAVKFKNDRIRRIFYSMCRRCYIQNDKAYKWYGARGIKVCDEWLNNPKSFEDWALSNGYANNLTINRKNEKENYCPNNCEWIQRKDNSKYKSTTSLIEVDGEIHTGKEWARILGFGENRINTYVKNYGIDNVIEFIRRYKASPTLKLKQNQSYYNLYMNNIKL